MCPDVVVAGVRCVGRGRKTWGECVKEEMNLNAIIGDIGKIKSRQISKSFAIK